MAVVFAAVVAVATLAVASPPVGAADEVAPTDIGPRDSPCTAGDGLGAANPFGGVSNDAIDSFMLGLVSGAAREISGDATGWLLKNIFNKTSDAEKTRQEIAAVGAKIDLLNAKVDQLKQQMDTRFDQQFTETERTAYDVSAAIFTADAAKLLDYTARMDSWSRKDPGSTVDGAQSAVLLDMRNNLGFIIQHLNLAMMGTGGGRGLIEIFGSVTFRNQPGFASGLTTQHEIYTSDYTTPVYDQLSYYKGLAVLAFNMLAEVNHLSWTSGSITYEADPGYVQTYAACLGQFFTAWDQKAAHSVGRLPTGVAVDQRTGLMWTRGAYVPGQGVDPNGNEGSDPRVCFTCAPELPGVIQGATIEGFTGWRLPTANEVNRLLLGRTKKNPSAFLYANSMKWPSFTVNAGTQKFRQNRSFYVSDPWAAGGQTAAFITDDIFNRDDDHLWFAKSGRFEGAIGVRVHRTLLTGVQEPELPPLVFKADVVAAPLPASVATPTAAPVATVTVVDPRFTG